MRLTCTGHSPFETDAPGAARRKRVKTLEI